MAYNLAPLFRAGAAFDVAVPANTAAAVSTALPASPGLYAIRLNATVDTYVAFNGTAAAGSSLRLVAGFPETFLVTGDTSISAISASTTAGILNVVEMSR